jgi:Protein kinase domain
MREAETSARLSHPNIVPIFSVDERDGLAWFVMALVEGESLGDRIRKLGAVTHTEARRIMREVADALGYAHAHGVVHRDIKPDNILLDAQSGRAMVTDFGIAQATTDGSSRLTATGTAIGTPAFMSPEQCSGDRQLDGRSDLYSLGAVAYYMLTSQLPFDGPSTPVIMMKHVSEQPVPISQLRPDVPADLERIAMRLLEKDPSRRFPDGGEVVAALDGAHFDFPDRATNIDSPYELPGGVPFMPPLGPLIRNAILAPPGMEPIPGWNARVGSFHESRRLRRDQRRQFREALEDRRPLPDRIRSFRRHLVSYFGTSAFLFGINAVTGGAAAGHHVFWWAAFPALAMMLRAVNEGGSLWAAGARVRDVFGRSATLPASVPTAMAIPGTPSTAASSLPSGASPEVLSGPRGKILRQAMADRNSIHDLVARMGEGEQKMLPDVDATAGSLHDRIVALAVALHRLDEEIGPERLPELDARIAESESSAPDNAEDDRRLRLLRHQREMLAKLLESRDSLSEQYESAGLLLQNLRLDMMRMRSSGLQSGLADVTSVTQEARALSKEIGYVLAAADELRDIHT